MAVRSALRYMSQMVIRELGLGCYVPASVAAGATSIRVLDSSLFDPAGGQLMIEDNDNLITYTAIDGDTLTGVPSSSTGSISATINPVDNSSRDLIYRPGLMSAYEFEALFDRFRRWVEGEALRRDVERKKHFSLWRWYDTGVVLRTTNTDTYDSVVADTIDYENGTFQFNTARSLSEQLYLYGWTYNVYFVIADFIERFANDERWLAYSAIGQQIALKRNAREIAEGWRARGKFL